MTYYTLHHLVHLIDEPNRNVCHRILEEECDVLKNAKGSSYNHQAWEGGYLDHVTETMNIAFRLYMELNSLRLLEFSLSDVLLVIFIHDLEKPWKPRYNWTSKQERHEFRINKVKEYGMVLTPDLEQAILYAEGEIINYSNTQRMMSPLAAFVHMCDVCSARIWYDRPWNDKDIW